jgi:chromate transporter
LISTDFRTKDRTRYCPIRQIGKAFLADLTTVLMALTVLLLLLRYQVNSTWLVLGGALLRWAFSLLQ